MTNEVKELNITDSKINIEEVKEYIFLREITKLSYNKQTEEIVVEIFNICGVTKGVRCYFVFCI